MRIWANPLICSKIAKYPISESIIIYPIGVANARNIPKYPLGYGHGLYLEYLSTTAVATRVEVLKCSTRVHYSFTAVPTRYLSVL